MTIRLNVPYLEYDQMRMMAENFLREQQAWGKIPVRIEKIIDIQMEIDIIPLPDLLRRFDIDAFISGDLRSISIDRFIYESRSNRRRFSLAHETAHAILHRRFLEPFSFNTIDQYQQFLAELDERDVSRMESQAYCFAGLLLVPTPFLSSEFQAALRDAEAASIPIMKWRDIASDYVYTHLGRKFEVSTQVISLRVDYDNLWDVAQTERRRTRPN